MGVHSLPESSAVTAFVHIRRLVLVKLGRRSNFHYVGSNSFILMDMNTNSDITRQMRRPVDLSWPRKFAVH
jgi:hypothetical protein